MTRSAPLSIASTISSPVPAVDAATGSFAAAPPTSSNPEALAISMTAVRPSRRQAASTGVPNGPVTVLVRLGPPSTSRVPSPPSAMGTSSQVHPAATAASPIAAATSAAVAVPRSLSGAATTRRSAVDLGPSPLPSAAEPMPAIVADGGHYRGPDGHPLVRPADRPRLQPRPGHLRDRGRRLARRQAGRGRARVRHRPAGREQRRDLAGRRHDRRAIEPRRPPGSSRRTASACACSPSTPRPTGSPTTW